MTMYIFISIKLRTRGLLMRETILNLEGRNIFLHLNQRFSMIKEQG